MSKIEWTGETWNPIVGCSIVSPGCTNCYAMRMAARLERMGVAHYAGTTQASKAGPVWTGKLALAPDHIIAKPLGVAKPTTWFVNSMSDLFHEDVPDEWIDRVFAVMALCPQHTFQVLTKRSDRMRAYLARHDVGLKWSFEWLRIAGEPMPHPDEAVEWTRRGLPNVWLGVSAERQQEADARIPDLLATPAAVRFVSAEPLLGPIDFTARRLWNGRCDACVDEGPCTAGDVGINWIIVGGESGHGARPMHREWAESIVGQCRTAGVAVFVKQMGAAYIDEQDGIAGAALVIPKDAPKVRRLRDRKGGEMAEWPADLRVREMPDARTGSLKGMRI